MSGFRSLPAESACRDCRGLTGILAAASILQTFQIANPSAVLKSSCCSALRSCGSPAGQIIALADGTYKRLVIGEAKEVALATAPRVNDQPALLIAAEEIDEDQWTLNRYHQEQSIFRFAFGDPDRSVLYVSAASGRVILRTTLAQRFWNWLGAIPHWLYLEPLRTDPWLWTQTVIWTSSPRAA
jgi:hypothetical protein